MPGITPINSEIPLQGVSPIKTLGDLTQVDNIRSEMAYRQQQGQVEAQLKQAQTQHATQQAEEQKVIAAQKKRELQSQQAAQDYLSDPDRRKQFYETGDDPKLAGLMDPNSYATLQTKHAAALQELGTAKSKNLANDKEFLGQAVSALNGAKLLGKDDPTKIVDAMNSALPGLTEAARGTRFEGKLPNPGSIRTPEQVDQLAQGLGGLFDLHTAAIKQKGEELGPVKTQSEIDKTAADVAEAKSKVFMQDHQRFASQLALAAMQSPQALAEAKALLPTDHQASFANATDPQDILRLGMTPDQQVTTTNTAAGLRQTAKYQQGELKNSADRIAIERDKNGREQKIYDQTYGDGANQALIGVDPHLRTAATAAAQKAANEHIQATAAADEMQSLIDLAKNGNKVAYAYAPTTGVLTINSGNGVKRVNMAEIEQYAGAGSALDRVKGWFGKQATGASIPDDVLNDMASLHATLAGVSGKAYNDKIAAINQNYRSNFQPVANALPPTPPPPPTAIPARLSASDIGKTYYNRQGQVLKITAVNPDDPTQFKSEVVKGSK